MASLLAEAARIAGADGRVQDRVVAIRLLGLADAKTARALFPKLLDARQADGRSTGGLAGSGGPLRSRSGP